MKKQNLSFMGASHSPCLNFRAPEAHGEVGRDCLSKALAQRAPLQEPYLPLGLASLLYRGTGTSEGP
jgi:hypothetical protein